VAASQQGSPAALVVNIVTIPEEGLEFQTADGNAPAIAASNRGRVSYARTGTGSVHQSSGAGLLPWHHLRHAGSALQPLFGYYTQ